MIITLEDVEVLIMHLLHLMLSWNNYSQTKTTPRKREIIGNIEFTDLYKSNGVIQGKDVTTTDLNLMLALTECYFHVAINVK